MPKANKPCPCGSGIKFKKCCRSKGLFKKKNIDDPTKWKDYGKSHPLYRFSIGQRVECNGMSGHRRPGRIKQFDYIDREPGNVHQGMAHSVPYWIKLDDGGYMFTLEDIDHYVRAFGTTEDDYVVPDPTTLKDFGKRDPSLRFAIGQRVETKITGRYLDQGRFHQDISAAGVSWVAGTIVRLNWCEDVYKNDCDNTQKGKASLYRVSTDTGVQMYINTDTNEYVRPLGMTKGATDNNQTCSQCGVAGSSTLKLSACGGCKRTVYCSRDCQKFDRKNHKQLCKAIILEKKRMALDAKKHTAATDPEEWANNLAIAAKEGNINLIKRVLNMKKKSGICFDINQKVNLKTVFQIQYSTTADDEAASALWIACKFGNVDVLDRLLREKDIDVNSDLSDGTTPLCQLLLLFFSSSCFVSLTIVFVLFCCTDIAVELNNFSIVERLLQVTTIDVNRPIAGGFTPFLVAAWHGRVKIVDSLLKQHTLNRKTCLMGWLTLMDGNPEMCVQKNWTGTNALMIASEFGHANVVERLLCESDFVNAINKKNGRGKTALFLAQNEYNVERWGSSKECSGAIKVLVAAGATI